MDISNVRALIRSELGVPKNISNKMSKSNARQSFKTCKGSSILPPMDFKKFGEDIYLIDPKSPLTARDFAILFGKNTQLDEIKRISKKLGLVAEYQNIRVLKSHIIQILKILEISEPVQLPHSKKKSVPPLNSNTGNFVPPSNSNNSIPPSNNSVPSLPNSTPSFNTGGGPPIPQPSKFNLVNVSPNYRSSVYSNVPSASVSLSVPSTTSSTVPSSRSSTVPSTVSSTSSEQEQLIKDLADLRKKISEGDS